MARINSIRYIGKDTVYNITVDGLHNFITPMGTVLHNCDGVRYFAINRKLPAEAVISPTSPRQKYEEWMQSQDNGGEEYDTYMCGGEPTPSYIGVG